MALHPLGTDHVKHHMTDAPWIVVLFAEKYGIEADGSHRKHYYVDESVGIAVGILITALHLAGLATLTHTPSPMGFLNELCGLDSDHRPFLLLVVGHPADDAKVPDIGRRPLDQIAKFIG